MTRRQLLASAAVGVASIAATFVTRSELQQDQETESEPGTLGSLTQPLTDAKSNVLSRVPQPFASMAASARQADAFHSHIGWAYTCDISIPPEQMLADMQRMRDLGCTSV